MPRPHSASERENLRGTLSIRDRLRPQLKESGVISYYCIVNMPGVPAREIRVLKADDDAAARNALAAVVDEWFGFSTLCLYHGERLVEVRSNPDLGFPTEPLLANALRKRQDIAA